MSQTLKKNKVRMVKANEALELQARGAAIVDIRPDPEFVAGHIPGSVSIPFLRPITGWDARKALRRAGFAFFGIFNGTEANPDFMADLQAQLAGRQGAVLVCNMGGTLEPTGPSDDGQQSRSLMAAYEAVQAGLTGIVCLQGGFYQWRRDNRPIIAGSDEE